MYIFEIIKLVAIGLGSTLYIGFLFFLYRSYTNQRKMNEAFFKFERHDLNAKIKHIRDICKSLEEKSVEWFVESEFRELKKKH